MNNKKKKIIVSALGATALGAGITVAAVAQACGTTTSSEGSNQTIALDSFRALSGTNTAPPNNTSELTFYNALLNVITAIDENVTSISIEILNSSGTTTANQEGTLITVTTGNINISSVGGTGATYSNSSADLTVSGVTFADNRVNAVGTISGLVQQNNETIAVDTFRELNTATSEPTDPGQAVFYRALLEEITRTNSAVTEITNIAIATGENVVTATNLNNQIQVNVTVGSLVINVNEGATAGRNWINSITTFTVANVSVTNGQVQTVGIATGLVEQTDAVLAGNAVRALNETTTPPANGTSELVFYNELLRLITDIQPATTINNISVDQSAVTSSEIAGVIAVTIAQDAIFIQTTGTITAFNNGDAVLLFSDITVNASGVVTGVGATTGLQEATPQNISENSFRNLNGINSAPAANTSELVLYTALLTAVRALDSSAVTAIAITIADPSNDVTADPSGTPITVVQNGISIIATGGSDGTYSNTATALSVPNVVITDGRITATGIVTGLLETNDSIIRSGFVALNGVTPATAPTTGSAAIFYNSLLTTIRIIDGSTVPVSGISITITDPETTITIPTNDTLTIATGSIVIAATDGLARTYTNNAPYTIVGIGIDMGVVDAADAATNSGVLVEIQQFTAETAFRALNTMSAPPSDASQLIFYNALLAAVNALDTTGTVTSITITITNPANVIADANGTSITVPTGSISILTVGANGNTYVNTTAALTFTNIMYNATGDVVTSAGTINDELDLSDASAMAAGLRALRGLNTATGTEPIDASQRILYNALLNFIVGINTGATINLITITDPTNSVSVTADATTLMITTNNIRIDTINGATNPASYTNATSMLLIEGVSFNSSGVIINTGTIIGLAIIV